MDVVLDTSVLINFIRIGRLDLLRDHPDYNFIVTDHVRAEIKAYYPQQLAALNAAIADGTLSEIAVTDLAELSDFAQLSALKVLGAGECSAIAVAKNRSLPLAIDDVRAQKKAKAFCSSLTFLDTVAIVVSLIQKGLLTVAEADAIKADWETNHRFTLKFQSFADII
jgi:predicted nucleic acid-binding protein